MPRYKLIVAYDGTDFCGWQKQEPLGESAGEAGQRAYSEQTPLIESTREGRVALRTVQGVLERAVREVVREPVELIGASRTDSGVHAKGQVAAFSCEPRDEELGSASEPAASASLPQPHPHPHCGWPLARGADRLAMAINSRLPEDVLVLSAEAAPHGFDPVTGAVSKGYSYTFWVSPVRPLWQRKWVHHLWKPGGLDVGAMNLAARSLVGEHDFAAFAAAGHGRLSTVRTVHALEVAECERGEGAEGQRGGIDAGKQVVIRISGNGFLWNMVRIIAGTLMQVGIGQRTAGDVARVLEGKDRTKAGPTLPGTGLCLEWIKY